MSRRFENITLFAICVLILAVLGCATHTSKHDKIVEDFYNPWLKRSFEKFLEQHPDPEQSIPLGQDNYRHTYIHDIKTQREQAINALSTLGETNTGRDDYYYIYLYVNSSGVIYKIDYRRLSEEW